MKLSDNISLLLKIPPTGFHIPDPKTKVPDYLLNDVRNFKRVNPDLNPRESAESFLNKWAGYKASFSVEVVESVFKIAR
jgi:hypothetical protein